ncbi:MAG TPA: hypothetical protein VGM91_12850 [Conexibacter sp.]
MRRCLAVPLTARLLAGLVALAGCGGTSGGGSTTTAVDPSAAEVNPAGTPQHRRRPTRSQQPVDPG